MGEDQRHRQKTIGQATNYCHQVQIVVRLMSGNRSFAGGRGHHPLLIFIGWTKVKRLEANNWTEF